jgi:hypothetical protein
MLKNSLSKPLATVNYYLTYSSNYIQATTKACDATRKYSKGALKLPDDNIKDKRNSDLLNIPLGLRDLLRVFLDRRAKIFI